MGVSGYSGTVTKNTQIATIDNWGPEYRVEFDIMVHSAGKGFQSIFQFTTIGKNTVNIGDHVPTILFYYSTGGYLRIVSAVNEKGYYQRDHSIDLKKWYHIEIVQAKKNGKVRYYHYNLLLFKYYILVLLHRQYRWR